MMRNIRPYAASDLATLAELVNASGIREQYDKFAGPGGVEHLLADPWTPVAGVRLAFADGEPAGFAYAIVLPGPPAPWAALRGGVLPGFRRRGIGRALHEAVVGWLGTQAPPVRELAMSAWQPEPGADAFVAALGYSHDRWLWLMERPRGAAPPPHWPDGVSVRVLDGSDAMLADWNGIYNDSFAEHYRYIASPLDRAHALAKQPGFRPDGVLLAYRDGRVAGFCRIELHDQRGEIGTLGTTRAARRIGLGRALLRWGVQWLERETSLPVTLMVDGGNDGALALYKSERFEVMRTRRSWARPWSGA